MRASPPLFPQDDGPPQISTLRPGGQPQPNAWGSGAGLRPGRPRMARGPSPVIFVAAALVVLLAAVGTASGKGNTGPGVPGIDQILPLLPNSPVAVGARWSKSFDQTNPFGKGAIHYDTTSTFLRFEQVNGARAAVVQTAAALPIDLSISERKALAGTGQRATGLDRGTNPVDRFSGHIDFSQIASIDPNTKS